MKIDHRDWNRARKAIEELTAKDLDGIQLFELGIDVKPKYGVVVSCCMFIGQRCELVSINATEKKISIYRAVHDVYDRCIDKCVLGKETVSA